MGQPEEPLIDLGRHLAALQDAAPEARIDVARARARLLHATAGGRRPTLGLALAAALASLIVGVVAGFVVGRPADPLRFEIGAPEPGVVGAWIAAPSSGPRAIRFSDGSEIDLAPEGRARITAVDADGAEIALERGALSASVVHRAHTRWTVRVGPFQVHVIGTRFNARWDPATEQLEVALREGAVTVSGRVAWRGARRPRGGGDHRLPGQGHDRGEEHPRIRRAAWIVLGRPRRRGPGERSGGGPLVPDRVAPRVASRAGRRSCAALAFVLRERTPAEGPPPRGAPTATAGGGRRARGAHVQSEGAELAIARARRPLARDASLAAAEREGFDAL